jgi:hypothetical protein
MNDEQYPDGFTVHPVSSREAEVRVSGAKGSVVVQITAAEANADVRLTGNEARVLANVLNSTARRMEARR